MCDVVVPLQEERQAADARLLKLKLQAKVKVANLNKRIEELTAQGGAAPAEGQPEGPPPPVQVSPLPSAGTKSPSPSRAAKTSHVGQRSVFPADQLSLLMSFLASVLWREGPIQPRGPFLSRDPLPASAGKPTPFG